MNAKKNRMKYLRLLPLLLVAAVSGCWLFSGTWVIIYNVDAVSFYPTEHFYKFSVDLTEETIWQDHKDDLDNIEDIALTFKLVNPGGTDLTGQVYVSPSSTLDSASVVDPDSATIILNGIVVPAGQTLHVDMAYYYDLFENFEPLRDLVKTGVFTAYALVPEPFDGGLFDVTVVVTFSAGI